MEESFGNTGTCRVILAGAYFLWKKLDNTRTVDRQRGQGKRREVGDTKEEHALGAWEREEGEGKDVTRPSQRSWASYLISLSLIF